MIPNAEFTEMPRNSERSFCCGAGGARMWMEENIGERINVNRTTEAVETGADQIAVGCPFCRVMLSDGLTAKQADGSAREEVEVLDVAQLLLASVKRGDAPAPSAGPVPLPQPPPVVRRPRCSTSPTPRPRRTSRRHRPPRTSRRLRHRRGSRSRRPPRPSPRRLEAAPAAAPEEARGRIPRRRPRRRSPRPSDVTQTEDTVTATEEVGAAARGDPGPAPSRRTRRPRPRTRSRAASPASESADVTEPEIGEAESTAPDEDVAVGEPKREAAAEDGPADENKDDDKLF